MATLKQRILVLVTENPGLTDRELTNRIMGTSVGQQAVNQAARAMAGLGQIIRRERPDGKLGNYAAGPASAHLRTVGAPASCTDGEASALSENDVKRKLQAWLEAAGWQVRVRRDRAHGVDIDAKRDGKRWVIECKGCGSLGAMRVNYFLAVLGELLQRMHDQAARYSIALPDMKQFRGLWTRLPSIAKSRTQITALFVGPTGDVEEVP